MKAGTSGAWFTVGRCLGRRDHVHGGNLCFVEGKGSRLAGVSEQVFVQVVPERILSINQVQFPVTRPMFDVLFSSDRHADVVMPFSVNQSGQVISLREPVAGAGSMFPCAMGKIVRYPDIQRSERLIRHDVNPSAAHGASVSGDGLTIREAGNVVCSQVLRWCLTIPSCPRAPLSSAAPFHPRALHHPRALRHPLALRHPRARPGDHCRLGAWIDPRVEPGDDGGQGMKRGLPCVPGLAGAPRLPCAPRLPGPSGASQPSSAFDAAFRTRHE